MAGRTHMIPTDLAARLRALMETAVHPLAAVREVPTDPPDLPTGKRFSATIQDALPDGTYRALVAGKSMTLSLPQSARTGDTLELVVIGRSAKSVVAVEAHPPNQPVPLPPAATDPTATLSRTAQIIASLMNDDGGPSIQPTAMARSAPLLAEPPLSGKILAPVLQTAVTESGLFYEAHQAKWIAGQFPTDALLREPQARHVPPLPPATTPTASTPSGSITTGLRTAQAQGTGAEAAPPAPEKTHAASPQLQANAGILARAVGELETAALAGNREPPPPRTLVAPTLPDDLAPLVRQQLDTLANHHVVLLGQAWPNQTLEWQIEDARRESTADGPDVQSPRWTTMLRLVLPGLGDLAATLAIEGKSVGVALRVANPRSAETLHSAGADLARTLAEAGLRLQSMTVERADHA